MQFKKKYIYCLYIYNKQRNTQNTFVKKNTLLINVIILPIFFPSLTELMEKLRGELYREYCV